jgi:hypothetical protein
MFSLWGVRGQRIFVEPRSKLVMVKTAVHKQPNDPRPTLEGKQCGWGWCASSVADDRLGQLLEPSAAWYRVRA